MTGETVLIAAFSGRALAQSARRAGYKPLVVDCFGDLDMQAAAEAFVCLPARVQVGFIPRPLYAALDELIAKAETPPIGLVLGSGFECNPRFVERIAQRYTLLGNPADVIRASKDPTAFFAMLERLGIRHPETQLTAPADTPGWLMKRTGGSGGLHIHNCPVTPRPDKRRYFQKRIGGEAISIFGLIGSGGPAFAFSRQWTSPQPRRPYRYGGAVGPITPDEDLEARLVTLAHDVTNELGLTGLVSLDVLIEDGEPSLLEVNPRPGATLDVFDDGRGSLFRAHIEAARGGDAAEMLMRAWDPPHARAAAILYADRGPLTIPSIDWPDWAADRPQPGSSIAKYQPLATVIADANTPDAAERLCRERLGELENMLYESSTSTNGPRPEMA